MTSTELNVEFNKAKMILLSEIGMTYAEFYRFRKRMSSLLGIFLSHREALVLVHYMAVVGDEDGI